MSVKDATRYASFSSSPPFIARRSYPPFRRYLNEGHPSPLIPLPQFHARRMPQKFPPTSIQKDENTLSPSLSLSTFLFFLLNPRLNRKKNLWAFRDRIRAIAILHFLFVRTTTDRCPQGANPMLFLATRYSTRAQGEIPTPSPLWLSDTINEAPTRSSIQPRLLPSMRIPVQLCLQISASELETPFFSPIRIFIHSPSRRIITYLSLDKASTRACQCFTIQRSSPNVHCP